MFIKTPSAKDYVQKLLDGKSSVHTREIEPFTELDYIMLATLACESGDSEFYGVEFFPERVIKNGYDIPAMRIFLRRPLEAIS